MRLLARKGSFSLETEGQDWKFILSRSENFVSIRRSFLRGEIIFWGAAMREGPHASLRKTQHLGERNGREF